MNLIDLLKKNIVMVPVVASLIVGTYTGIKYIVNLTDSINGSVQEIVNLQRDLTVLEKQSNLILQKLERAEGTWEMAENLYELLANRVNDMDYGRKFI